jgi:hypothetical protein
MMARRMSQRELELWHKGAGRFLATPILRGGSPKGGAKAPRPASTFRGNRRNEAFRQRKLFLEQRRATGNSGRLSIDEPKAL